MNINLENYGLTKEIEENFATYSNDYYLGRIVLQHKNIYKVVTTNGILLSEIRGIINLQAHSSADYPAIGDWVILDRNSNQHGHAIIHHILPRKSKLSRKIAGNTYDEQIIATNIDTLFICMSLNNDFNLRRLERYVTVAYDSGATPVIVLTKTDLCNDIENRIIDVSNTAPLIDIHPVSSLTNEGLTSLDPYITQGNTIAFIGSSGVGKSTLINTLSGENLLKTAAIRSDDDRGKHTTTHRELISIQKGCSLIDTPGMRELSLLDDVEGVSKSFEDIEALALSCKFTNCTHTNEPGCQIIEALNNSTLDANRYRSYQKLLKEAEYAKRKQSTKASRDYGRNFYKMTKNIKSRP